MSEMSFQHGPTALLALVVSFVWQYPDVTFDVSRPLVATLGWKAVTLLEPSKERVHATAKLYDSRSLDGFNVSTNFVKKGMHALNLARADFFTVGK
jgi:hypothetical protein